MHDTTPSPATQDARTTAHQRFGAGSVTLVSGADIDTDRAAEVVPTVLMVGEYRDRWTPGDDARPLLQERRIVRWV